MFNRFFLSLATFVIVFTSCNQVKKTPGGIEYKIIKAGNGTRIAGGDMVFFKLIAKNADSVIMNSANSSEFGNYRAQINEKFVQGNFDEVMTMLGPDDSAFFKINADTFYLNYFHQPTPAFIKKATTVDFYVHIDSVITKATMDARKLETEKKNKEKEAAEPALIEEYVKNSGKNFTKTASGMYYLVTKKTSGKLPASGDMISANYTGMLFNGTVFDTNTKSGKPFEFALGGHQVIAGWDEAFALLHEGETATLVIPSSLAYGSQNAGPEIGPFTPLVFDVELLKITKSK